jgi:glyoxylase-like metal-dependent hydrolase (beta-lactamase superfamily II)
MNSLFETAGLVVFERGWLSCNNILFGRDQSAETVLIDSGYCSHSAQTVSLVQRILGPRPLDRVINTHLHSDHCGGNHALQTAFDCRVDVPAGEASKVDEWDEAKLTYRATGQQCPRFLRTGSIRGGETVKLGERFWQVIAAPGHDPESVALYEPELQLLISADALWENGFGVVFPELEGLSAFDTVRQTLDLLGELPVRCVIPGHGPPFEDARSALVRAHSRLDGFLKNPRKHALYAAKVLVKFHLLERRRIDALELAEWMSSTPYMQLVHGRYFEQSDFGAWCSSVVDSLVASGAAHTESGIISDR